MRAHSLFYSLVLHGLLVLGFWLIPALQKTPPRLTEFEILDDSKVIADIDNQDKLQDLAIQDPLKSLKDQVYLLSEKALRFRQQSQQSQKTKSWTHRMGQLEKKFLPQSKLSFSESNIEKKLAEELNLPTSSQPMPSLHSELAHNLPQGQMAEIFPNIAEGGFTILNVDPVKYSGFFRRLGDLVRDPWIGRVSDVVNQTYPSHFTNVLINRWTTLVELVLLEDGRVLDAVLLKKSGQEGFDRSALAALRETLVIPNPPRSLLQEDGLFHLKISFNVFIEPKILAKDPAQKNQTQ